MAGVAEVGVLCSRSNIVTALAVLSLVVVVTASCQSQQGWAYCCTDEIVYTIRDASIANLTCSPSDQFTWIASVVLATKEYDLGVGYRRTWKEDYTRLDSDKVYGGSWRPESAAQYWPADDWRELGALVVSGGTAELTLIPATSDARLTDLNLQGEFAASEFQRVVNGMQKWCWQWGTKRQSPDTFSIEWHLTGMVDGSAFTIQCTQAFRVLRDDFDVPI